MRRCLLSGLAMLVVLFTTGCGGAGGGHPQAAVQAAPGQASSATNTLEDPAAFAASVEDPATVTINVHVPDQGSLVGTDASIPFDRIRQDADRLPASRDTRLAIYCRSGRMSAIAARTLADLGYRRTVELRGGMRAWQAAGRTLLPPARH